MKLHDLTPVRSLDSSVERLPARSRSFATAKAGNPPKSRSAGRRRMTLFVGLGNPGKEYIQTRHNYGYVAVDVLAELLNAPAFKKDVRNGVLLSSIVHNGLKVFLAKPLMFMNESGTSVGKLVRYHRVPPEDLWILHDDMDLAVGTIRHSYDSRSAGHNGVQSIIDALGTKAFHRIRIGIGASQKTNIPAEQYVLERPSKADDAAIRSALREYLERLVEEAFFEK